MPEEDFHLILCRNLLFTYYDEGTQRQILARLLTHLLPAGTGNLSPWPGTEQLGIFRFDRPADKRFT